MVALIGNLITEIEKLELDGIQNAANGIGVMGRGIAGAIRKAGGDEIMHDAFAVCTKLNPKPGQAYSTISGSLKERGIKRIIHAVTMKNPSDPTTLQVAKDAFESALKLAQVEGITRLGCTALGTGVGGLDPEGVALVMKSVLDNWQGHLGIEVFFVDFNEVFIRTLNRAGKNG
jgi:O-acetyl-ADP-ribose deacetylase (regulator of RNase III)